MNMSAKGREYLAAEGMEGTRLHVYKDSAGKPTIGVGHLLKPNELNSGLILIGREYVEYKKGLTKEQTDTLLYQDLWRCDAAINKEVTVQLNQCQYDALCMFIFNVGVKAFEDSTLLKLLNQGAYDAVPDQLRRWTKQTVKGKLVKCDGLVNRREKEIKVWNGEAYKP